MLYNKLGNSDMLISRLGIGTLHHGVYVGPKKERLVHQAIDFGINFLKQHQSMEDQSESLLGNNIKH